MQSVYSTAPADWAIQAWRDRSKRINYKWYLSFHFLLFSLSDPLEQENITRRKVLSFYLFIYLFYSFFFFFFFFVLLALGQVFWTGIGDQFSSQNPTEYFASIINIIIVCLFIYFFLSVCLLCLLTYFCFLLSCRINDKNKVSLHRTYTLFVQYQCTHENLLSKSFNRAQKCSLKVFFVTLFLKLYNLIFFFYTLLLFLIWLGTLFLQYITLQKIQLVYIFSFWNLSWQIYSSRRNVEKNTYQD